MATREAVGGLQNHDAIGFPGLGGGAGVQNRPTPRPLSEGAPAGAVKGLYIPRARAVTRAGFNSPALLTYHTGAEF